MHTPQGGEWAGVLPHGAHVAYRTPERDDSEPYGVLIMQPICAGEESSPARSLDDTTIA